MTSAVRRLTADQETSLPEHDELLALACTHHDAIVARAFLHDEATPHSKRSLRALRDAGIASFVDKLNVTAQAITRTMENHTSSCVRHDVSQMLDILRQARLRVGYLLDGSTLMPSLAIPVPVEYIDCEVMRPLYELGAARPQGRKKIAGYVDLTLTTRRISAATVVFPSFVSPLRGRPVPDLFSTQSSHLSRAIESAQEIINATPSWALTHSTNSEVWITVRSQSILIGETLQELKMLRERMHDESVPGHVGVFGPMTDAIRHMIEAEGFLAFDKTEHVGLSKSPIGELSRHLPCDIQAYTRQTGGEQRHAMTA